MLIHYAASQLYCVDRHGSTPCPFSCIMTRFDIQNLQVILYNTHLWNVPYIHCYVQLLRIIYYIHYDYIYYYQCVTRTVTYLLLLLLITASLLTAHKELQYFSKVVIFSKIHKKNPKKILT